MKLFIIKNKESDLKCGGCNWGCSTFYAYGKNKKHAKSYFKETEEGYGKGLCAHCMCGLIVDNKWDIGVRE